MSLQNILVIGSTGFIGSYITARVIKAGYSVKCAVRDVALAKNKFPSCDVVKFDFNNLNSQELLKHLKEVDVVINVAGVLNNSFLNDIKAVHSKGPKELLDLCIEAKVKRFIHISALGIENEKETSYSNTKKEFDKYLASNKKIDWVILRPSLVYASGCFGGTSLLRGLASLPFFIPLIGDGKQKFQPVHMDDLTSIVEGCVLFPKKIQKLFDVVGSEVVTVEHILKKLRGQLGLREVKSIRISEFVVNITAKLADLFGCGPLSSTSLKMMQHPNIGNSAPIVKFLKIIPRGFDQGIETTPLTVQSLWHARLYLLKPLMLFILAIFWILSGAIPLFADNSVALNLINKSGFSSEISLMLFYLMCSFDILLGTSLLFRKFRHKSLQLQFWLVLIYTLSISYINPHLWLDPLGSLMKNIPVLMLILFLISIDEDK